MTETFLLFIYFTFLFTIEISVLPFFYRNFFVPLILIRVTGWLEPIRTFTGQEAEYTRDRSTQRHSHSLLWAIFYHIHLT